jgi:ubiquinone/menaquinone biosynthesis C-methylase UbiE
MPTKRPSLLRAVYHSLPPSVAKISHRTFWTARSFRDQRLKHQLFGEKASFVPPFHLMEDGPRDYKEFKQNGIDTFQRFLSLGLRPEDKILDIGSGIGRKTLPLLDYITSGTYDGIDPVAKQVKWCQEKITSRYPNFRFQRIDVWSKNYNPSGAVQPSEYRFPFDEAQFDFVMLGSVFTHMFPDDVDHYIGEISRVLKPGGKGWVTFFLLNKESETAIADKTSTIDLAYEVEQGSRADNPNRLESAIGHQEQLVRQMFAKHNIQADIAEYGSWCGRQAPSYQDVFKITKR